MWQWIKDRLFPKGPKPPKKPKNLKQKREGK